MVPPVDPLEGRVFEVVEAAPGPAVVHKLGFVEADHALGERIVIRIAAGSDRVEVLRRSLTHAERFSLVPRNVAKLAAPPRASRQEITPLTVDEAHQLFRTARSDRLRALYTLALGLGLRQGELLAVHWRDVDLEAGTLSMRVVLAPGKDGPTFTEPKSARSRRTVMLPPICLDALRDHRARQAAERLAAGPRWEDHGLVFSTPLGTPLDASNLRKHFKRLCASAGIGDRRFHDLRHTCASFLLNQGVPARAVMEVLGHSQISLTLNTYTHVMPAMLSEAADQMDRVLRG